MNNTKIITVLLLAMLMCSGCRNAEVTDTSTYEGNETLENVEHFTLTSEELDIIEKMGDDVIVIPNTEYNEIVKDINKSSSKHIGKVYTLEGYCVTLDVHGTRQAHLADTPDMADSSAESVLPLRYLKKEIPEKAHIRVTAIVATDDHDAHSHVVLDVVAVETID